ncbi:shikimate dehydrogenase [Constrictibacter sp. MBR-5]|jgi:shikimate dehydrogenase|uniref:shikimate dehydrogenase n=1 Tax=Constrictibacter sp. MBR-5 TaxID=3156467 RepID=UPI003398E2C5
MILTGKARIAGVMGWPVSHSRSPRLHGFWLERYGIDGAYVPFAIRPEDVEAALRALPKLGFAGTNVTVPHKETLLRLVDDVDPVARRIGAVNTVVVGADGSLSGSNTDAFGFLEHLRASAPGWSPAAGPAVILGAGGAARAVCAALADAGVGEIRILNRTRERADAVASLAPGVASSFDWRERGAALGGAALLVNTTTLGMAGQAPLELDLADLPTTAVVDDIVYVPLETELLRAARARGNVVVDGLGMLLHQARPGFAAWFGVEPQVDDALRDFLLADLTR